MTAPLVTITLPSSHWDEIYTMALATIGDRYIGHEVADGHRTLQPIRDALQAVNLVGTCQEGPPPNAP